MSTGTIIFIVVLVVQAVIRIMVKQAEKKTKAAKATAEGSQVSPRELTRNTEVSAPAIVAMPACEVTPSASRPTAVPVPAEAPMDARAYFAAMKQRIDQFAESAPPEVVAAIRGQWSQAVREAKLNVGPLEGVSGGTSGAAEKVGGRVVVDVTTTVDSSVDWDDEEGEEDPEGEATGTYLHDRAQQIHDGALRGRHPPQGVRAVLTALPALPAPATGGPLVSPLRKALASKAGLRDGILMAEVLGPPLSLRQPT